MSDGVHPNDVTLLDALRSGNGDAAAFVKQRHNRTLWRIARSILRDDGEAEEAVQDTWLRAFTAAHAYRGDASLGTWLARIVINEASRRAERHRPTVELAPIVDLLPVDHPGSATMAPPVGPEHAAARAEIRRVLDRASCFGSAQHLEPTTEAVIARRRYWQACDAEKCECLVLELMSAWSAR